jgi:hypothetical protein
VIYLDRVLLEVEEVREERAPHMLDNLVVTSSTPVYYGGSPEHALFDLFIHPGTAFAASHVMPPFISSVSFSLRRTLMDVRKHQRSNTNRAIRDLPGFPLNSSKW